jgi:hypothetical protein
MKGVDIKADRNRTLRYSINAMIEFKRERKVSISAALQTFAVDVDFELLRYIFWLGLKWEDQELTQESAGEVMDAAIEEMGFEALVNAIVEAISKAIGNEPQDHNPKNSVSH